MFRIAYVNGRYCRDGEAMVPIEDRGYQFADGVYEVCAIEAGHMVDLERHLERLERSLAALSIPWPMSRGALTVVLREVIRRNKVTEGLVYFQITRGVAPRDHAFPVSPTKPSLVVTAKRLDPAQKQAKWQQGINVISLPDERWAHPHIKTVALLPNCLAKQKAKEAGAYEAWLVDSDGFVTEGSSTNAWIVTAEGQIVTRPAGREILNGITRQVLLEIARENGFTVQERRFTVVEAQGAREAFITASSAFVIPVVALNGKMIGSGKPGAVSTRLRELLVEAARNQVSSVMLHRSN